jgi:transposase-like protein
MPQKAKCPECVENGRAGENLYNRDDGTFKCRTCGYDSKKGKLVNKNV